MLTYPKYTDPDELTEEQKKAREEAIKKWKEKVMDFSESDPSVEDDEELSLKKKALKKLRSM